MLPCLFIGLKQSTAILVSTLYHIVTIQVLAAEVKKN